MNPVRGTSATPRAAALLPILLLAVQAAALHGQAAPAVRPPVADARPHDVAHPTATCASTPTTG
jgi:hypothetical protein